MKRIRTALGFDRWRRNPDIQNSAIGFVPTMGALHRGHMSLMERARQSCDIVIVSIFVNPLQFGPTEDLDEYPRPHEKDVSLCQREGVDVVFLPSREEIYPPHFQTSVTVNRLTRRWEGSHRNTHFQGVTTVVHKLLNIVRPGRAYFGQKDYQQCRVIEQMVQDLHLDVEIVRCPTIREPDGLALSSRNGFLTPTARKQAPILYQALQAGKSAIRNERISVSTVESLMRKHVLQNPKTKIDYLNVCQAETLEPLRRIHGNIVLLGAIRLGKVRLIDNVLVKAPG